MVLCVRYPGRYPNTELDCLSFPVGNNKKQSTSGDGWSTRRLSDVGDSRRTATVEVPIASKRHRVSCGSISTSSTSGVESSGTKIIRSCSTGFAQGSELPLGRYHHLHQQQQQQQHPVDVSVLASAVRVAATIGLSVSQASDEFSTSGCDVSPTMHSQNSIDLPYILRSVSPQQGDLRLLAPPSGRGADGGARTRDIRVPADLRADSLSFRRPLLLKKNSVNN
ncbi:hypothetical protein PoB_005789500 [Plakobranchus ocellatus]|uniref:Uncharacterized protein n=1 Tax=Plakobranchus ocellatus TaxID=259542 RepID=A0AAV4CEZ4_9GAST|nr:hypothetical protein PoB_005789500 [Plakobranchus ocellatus]